MKKVAHRQKRLITIFRIYLNLNIFIVALSIKRRKIIHKM